MPVPPPLAEAAGERSEVDEVVTRTWFVRNQTPEQVLAFYEDWFADDGIEPLEALAPAGRDTWGAIWPWRDRELYVSATETTTVEGDEVEEADVVSQLSLELWPEGSSDHGDDASDDSSDDSSDSSDDVGAAATRG